MTYDSGSPALSPRARRAAAAIALVAAITLAARLSLRVEQGETVVAALSHLSQYFTILTNTMVLAMMLWIAFGRDMPPRLIKAVVISIVCVGLVYHALLAHLVSLSGAALWADHGTHTMVPLLSGLWWLFLAPKPPFRASDIALWVVWPVIYCIYILIRAGFSGFYPYPFLNVPEIGWGGVMTGVAGLLVAFTVVGLVLTALGRVVPGHR